MAYKKIILESDVDTELDLISQNPIANSAVSESLSGKQSTLISGTNIKTINDESILGSGNIEIVSEVDSELNPSSENPVANSAIVSAFEEVVSEIQNLQSELDDKQDTLISGTNIKTINNESILGEGNLQVTVEVDRSLNPSSENPVANSVITDELNNKQSTLISGTNIKTINNHSILGAGNIIISGEGELPIDYELDPSSDNAIANSPVATKLAELNSKITIINSDLQHKQDTLISGTNIKTINNESVLGEGNLDVISEVDSELSPFSENPVANSAITLSLSGKQQKLISGTNIKTINNQSILGAGNLEQSDLIAIDTELNVASQNPVTNSAIMAGLTESIAEVSHAFTEELTEFESETNTKIENAYTAGIPYQTTEPTSAGRTDRLILVRTHGTPSAFYPGYLYLVTE